MAGEYRPNQPSEPGGFCLELCEIFFLPPIPRLKPGCRIPVSLTQGLRAIPSAWFEGESTMYRSPILRRVRQGAFQYGDQSKQRPLGYIY